MLKKLIDYGEKYWASLLDLIASIQITCHFRQKLADGGWIGSSLTGGCDLSRIMVLTDWCLVFPDDLAGFFGVQTKATAERRDLWTASSTWQWKTLR